MRRMLLLLLSGALWLGAASPRPAAEAAEAVPGGNHYARIRANDAPIAGRFSIHAYLLDSLEAVVDTPGPGRVIALHFDGSNGKNAFLVLQDLALRIERRHWTGGFVSLTAGRLAGFLDENESRWALWWVPWGVDTLVWNEPEDLHLVYGLQKGGFRRIGDRKLPKVLSQVDWELVTGANMEGAHDVRQLVEPVDPASFDDPPTVRTRTVPEYPRHARVYNYEGTVTAAVTVNEEGTVVDARVLDSNAAHELNVAALLSVMEWTFEPGRKGGQPAVGEIVIPVTYSMGGTR